MHHNKLQALRHTTQSMHPASGLQKSIGPNSPTSIALFGGPVFCFCSMPFLYCSVVDIVWPLIFVNSAWIVQHSHSPKMLLQVHPEVAQALQQNKPVVALESTIISHGMPYPQNLQTALEVEAVVREHGAIPATIAIIQGKPCIGCTREQLEHIARRGTAVHKVSRRDLPAVLAAGQDGATTVSATMILAARAGIKVFVTGGIGGVHRGGEVSMDISADLTELGKTPIAVVCAGAKSVLDIPRTLEFLETQGVCVATLGRQEFPAFFTPHSGCKSPHTVDTPAMAAAMLSASLQLQLSAGMVLAVPIPDQYAAEGKVVQSAIETALQEVQDKGIGGNEVTPYLLDRIRVLTGGKSLEANIKLVKHNAAVGSAMAVAFANLSSQIRSRM